MAKEINGYYLEDVYDKTATPPKLLGKKGELCTYFVHFQADGSTSCGYWIYSGSYTQKDGKIINMMARRGRTIPRASVCIRNGHGLGRSTGGSSITAPRLIPREIRGTPTVRSSSGTRQSRSGKQQAGHMGGRCPRRPGTTHGSEKGKLPFIMRANGVGAIFGPGLADGPFPEHYEALECPLEENPMSKQRINPTIKLFGGKEEAFLLLRYAVSLCGNDLPDL